jgi:hypothetical protein
MAASIESNPSLPLECVDLSENLFDDAKCKNSPIYMLRYTKPCLALSLFGNALSKMTSTGIRELHMNNAHMSYKCVNHVANALFRQQLNSSVLTRLSFANNSLKDDVNVNYVIISNINKCLM